MNSAATLAIAVDVPSAPYAAARGAIHAGHRNCAMSPATMTANPNAHPTNHAFPATFVTRRAAARPTTSDAEARIVRANPARRSSPSPGRSGSAGRDASSRLRYTAVVANPMGTRDAAHSQSRGSAGRWKAIPANASTVHTANAMTAASLTASTTRPTVVPALNRGSVFVTVVESDRRALIAREASGARVLPARGAVAQHGGLLGQGLAGRLGHRLLESRGDGLGRERLQLFDQRLQLRQSLGGHARVEIVTPLDVQEHCDERVRYLAAVRDEHIEHREEMVEPVAEAGELTADADERGVGDTHAAVVLPVQHAERLQSREHGGVGLDAEVAREVGLTPHLGALGEPRAQRSPVEGDGLLSRRSGWAADEAADRGEVEALLLQA